MEREIYLNRKIIAGRHMEAYGNTRPKEKSACVLDTPLTRSQAFLCDRS